MSFLFTFTKKHDIIELSKGVNNMKVISAVDVDGVIQYIPIEKITLTDNTSDVFSVFKYQITFDKKTYDIDEIDFKQILGAMTMNEDTFHANTFQMIKLKELI